MSAHVDVLAGELRVTNTEYSPGITTTIAEAAASLPAGTYWLVSDEARAAVAELVEAVRERRRLSSHKPSSGPFAESDARLDAALAKFGVKP